ncbi:MAG: hypothetical protein V3V30_04800 [Parvularculaceae bacterium]
MSTSIDKMPRHRDVNVMLSDQMTQHRHLIVALSSFALLAFMVFQSWAGYGWSYALTIDDGPVESLSALMYFFAFIACAIAISRKKALPLAITWLILSFLFLGEETSWFQRQLGYSVPAVEGINAQSEFNFHNLTPFMDHSYGFFDDNGKFVFQPKTLLTSQYLFRIGFFLFFLALPLASLWAPFGKITNKLHYVAPSLRAMIVIWSVILASFIIGFLVSAHQDKMLIMETREFFYAAVIFAYSLIYILQPASLVERFEKRIQK